MSEIQNFNRLRQVIKKKLDQWNERSTFTISGVRNLTRSDIDALLMCCDQYERNDDLQSLDYFSPGVRRVLEEFDMYEEV